MCIGVEADGKYCRYLRALCIGIRLPSRSWKWTLRKHWKMLWMRWKFWATSDPPVSCSSWAIPSQRRWSCCRHVTTLSLFLLLRLQEGQHPHYLGFCCRTSWLVMFLASFASSSSNWGPSRHCPRFWIACKTPWIHLRLHSRSQSMLFQTFQLVNNMPGLHWDKRRRAAWSPVKLKSDKEGQPCHRANGGKFVGSSRKGTVPMVWRVRFLAEEVFQLLPFGLPAIGSLMPAGEGRINWFN